SFSICHRLQDLRDFLERCFTKDPNQRPKARDLLKHKWIINNSIQPSAHEGFSSSHHLLAFLFFLLTF
ncbi:MAG: hypothetical protein ACK41O_26385, partial [Runella zeae]